jgi:ribosomal protein S1
VLNVDVAKTRLTLSARQLQQDPLQQNIESLDWDDEEHEPLPEVRSIVAQMRKEPGVVGVLVGRSAEEKHIVSQVRGWQELELVHWWHAVGGVGRLALSPG